jgi:hypothetical protein
MVSPAMVIIFITACTLNIVKLKGSTVSRSIYGMALFANFLCVSFALMLSIQDPHIGKVITTIMMAIIFILSLISWLNYQIHSQQSMIEQAS